LRKASLDELPQLFNVLRGDMSLVGPRPVTETELILYGGHADEYLSVRPGVTGLWQVSGRNRLSYERRVALDSHYVKTQSLWRDVIILCKTAKLVLEGDGQ
jgi:undecaprenyl-phosphate galactose phosphotransferase